MESKENGNPGPKYCTAEVSFLKCKGDTHKLLKRSIKAIKKAGATPCDIQEFAIEVTSGDYIHMILTLKKWLRLVDMPD